MAQGFSAEKKDSVEKKCCCSNDWRSTEIAVNTSDSGGVSLCKLKTCLHKSVYEWAKGIHVWSGAAKGGVVSFSVQVCHAQNLLNSNYSTLHSNRHMLPLYLITWGNKKKTFTASDLTSFFPYEQASLCHGTLHQSNLSCLRKYRIRTEEMNFITLFSLSLLIDKGTTLTLSDFCSPVT